MMSTRSGDRTLYDAAMGLPNLKKLEGDIRTSRAEPGAPVHFVCYDIDSLRKINFSYGREAGDELLRQIAAWVVRQSGGELYRIDGDMFCLLLRGWDTEKTVDFANTAVRRSKGPWSFSGHAAQKAFVTAHMAVIPLDDHVLGQNLIDLFERILEISRNQHRVVLYDRGTDEMVKENIRLQMELRASVMLGMRGFSLAFQPIVDPSVCVWRGAEALSRWRRTDGKQVPPFIFIPEIERLGLMDDFGHWVLEQAVDRCKTLGLERVEGFFITVNVSSSQMNQADFAQRVLAVLRSKGYPPDKLVLEITESIEFQFNETTRAVIDALQKEDIHLALDDFGTGYSSIMNLKNLPVDYVKTEREYIKDIEDSAYLQYSLFTIAEAGHSNGVRLIAEGVETPEQLKIAVKSGADLLQGYYFSMPIAGNELGSHRERFVTPASYDEYGGSPFHFNITQWLSSSSAYLITPSLFALLSGCMKALLEEQDIDRAVNEILKAVGGYFNVNRVFIFLSEDGVLFDNCYEWCAGGIEEQRHLFQQVEGNDEFFDALRLQEIVIMKGGAELPWDMMCRLESGGMPDSVYSLIAMPLKRNGELIGFVGFDDDASREWMPEEILLLHNLCLLVLIRLNIRNV